RGKAPGKNLLAPVVAGAHTQHLHGIIGGGRVAIACLLADPDSHGCSLPQKVTSADLQSEPVVLIDMIAQKLMQPLPEDILDLAESEPRINLPRDPVTFVALPVFLTQPVETFLDFCGATDERARHLLAHDEELGNQPGLQALAIDSV